MQPGRIRIWEFMNFNIDICLKYIEDGYELFHLEGDEAVLQEIAEMLKRKGVDLK